MQKAFFEEEPLKSEAAKLVLTCNELIISALKSNTLVYTVRTEHSRTPDTWTLNMLDDKKGFLFRGQDESDYAEGLYITGTNEIIKTRDSAFWHTGLLTQLRQRGIDTVVLCGVSTHLCIAATATDAYNANLRVEIATESIASSKPELNQTFLDYLHTEFRMKLLSNADIEW